MKLKLIHYSYTCKALIEESRLEFCSCNDMTDVPSYFQFFYKNIHIERYYWSEGIRL